MFLGPLLFSQKYQTRDSPKVLALSNFKSMDVFENKNGKMNPKRNYSFDKSKNAITIKNIADKNKEWIMTIIKLDEKYNIQEVERIVEGTMISEKENTLVKKQASIIKKYNYVDNTIQIQNFNSVGNLSTKEFHLLDKKNRIIESLVLFNSNNDIIISEIVKYNWIDNKSYNYEKQTFNSPKTQIVGVYKLNLYGEIQSFEGSMTINGNKEIYNYTLEQKLKQFDSKGNLTKIYTTNKGKEIVLEERRIIY
jgi:hypothetical protein